MNSATTPWKVASAAALYATRLNPLWILSGGGVLGAALF